MSLWPKTIYKVLVMAPQSLTYLGPHRVAYVSHSGTEKPNDGVEESSYWQKHYD